MNLFRKRNEDRSAPLAGVDLEHEMAGLTRQYEGLIHQRRIEWLTARLGSGMAIRGSDCGFSGDRLTLWLDNEAILMLGLLWPERRPLVRLESIRRNPNSGWDVLVRTAAGETVTCPAWRATVILASEVPPPGARPVERPQRRTQP